jgi:hypothetical protein
MLIGRADKATFGIDKVRQILARQARRKQGRRVRGI